MQPSRIEWTDSVWNPVTGCAPVGPGCDNCYARRLHQRFRKRWGDRPFSQVTCHHKRLDELLRKRKPQRIFVCSMSDLFHRDVPFDFIALVMQKIAASPQHTFQVLTKRPARMVQWFKEWWRPDVRNRFKRGGGTYLRPRLFLRQPGCSECRYHFLGCLRGRKRWEDEPVTPNYRDGGHRNYFGHPEAICDGFEWHKDAVGHGVAVEMNNGEVAVRDEDCLGGFPGPLRNLWHGVTAESQDAADQRIPLLLETPSARRFVSLEPLLEPINLRLKKLGPTRDYEFGATAQARISWVIVGAETGPGARLMEWDWARKIRDVCRQAAVPLFVKQLTTNGRKVPWDEWPDDLKIREFPKALELKR